MKEKYFCLNRTCDNTFMRRVKSILDKVRCPKCGWNARPINVQITNNYTPGLWNHPRMKR